MRAHLIKVGQSITKNISVHIVLCVTIRVIDTNSHSRPCANSAQGNIQLSMRKHMIWQIGANKVKSLSLGLIYSHCKAWPNRKLMSSQCAWQFCIQWSQCYPWNNCTLSFINTTCYLSFKDFHLKLQHY